MFYWIRSGEDRPLLRPPFPPLFFLFVVAVFFRLEALPTCVIEWPLSACLLQSAVLCSRPRPPSPPLRSLPPYRLASLLFLPRLDSIYSSCCPESVLSDPQLLSSSLSCKDHFSQRWRCLICCCRRCCCCFSRFHLWNCQCAF